MNKIARLHNSDLTINIFACFLTSVKLDLESNTIDLTRVHQAEVQETFTLTSKLNFPNI